MPSRTKQDLSQTGLNETLTNPMYPLKEQKILKLPKVAQLHAYDNDLKDIEQAEEIYTAGCSPEEVADEPLSTCPACNQKIASNQQEYKWTRPNPDNGEAVQSFIHKKCLKSYWEQKNYLPVSEKIVTCRSCKSYSRSKWMHYCKYPYDITAYCMCCIAQWVTGEEHDCLQIATDHGLIDVNNEKQKNSKIPWIERGTQPLQSYENPDVKAFGASGDAYQKVWGFDPSLISPGREGCDYYILLFIRDGLYAGGDHEMLKPYRYIAGKMLAEQVTRLDSVFCAYMDMIIGGELRHHKATTESGVWTGINQSREQTWVLWKSLRQIVGTQLLLDAASLFREMEGGSIGGDAWAIIAETLHMRLTGCLSPELWLDRVFNLQHNGGIALNKVAWGKKSALMEENEKWQPTSHHGLEIPQLVINDSAKDHLNNPEFLQYVVGPAHDHDPPFITELSIGASRPVRRLLSEYLVDLRKERFRAGLRTLLPWQFNVEDQRLLQATREARRNGFDLARFVTSGYDHNNYYRKVTYHG